MWGKRSKGFDFIEKWFDRGIVFDHFTFKILEDFVYTASGNCPTWFFVDSFDKGNKSGTFLGS